MFNEASNAIGKLMACMSRSVWTVNLPALHQHDKQQCGMTEGTEKALTRPFEPDCPDTGRFAKTESLPLLPGQQ